MTAALINMGDASASAAPTACNSIPLPNAKNLDAPFARRVAGREPENAGQKRATSTAGLERRASGQGDSPFRRSAIVQPGAQSCSPLNRGKAENDKRFGPPLGAARPGGTLRLESADACDAGSNSGQTTLASRGFPV